MYLALSIYTDLYTDFTGCFKCLLPLGVSPGQTMEVAVPAGYPQAGRISRFVVDTFEEPLIQ